MQEAVSAQPLPIFSASQEVHLIMTEAGFNSIFLPWIKLSLIWRYRIDTFFFRTSIPLHVKREKKIHHFLPIAEKESYFITDPFSFV